MDGKQSDNADKSIRLATVIYNDGAFRSERKLICPIGVEAMASSWNRARYSRDQNIVVSEQ